MGAENWCKTHWLLDTLLGSKQWRALSLLRLSHTNIGAFKHTLVQEQIDILFRRETLLLCLYTQYEMATFTLFEYINLHTTPLYKTFHMLSQVKASRLDCIQGETHQVSTHALSARTIIWSCVNSH